MRMLINNLPISDDVTVSSKKKNVRTCDNWTEQYKSLRQSYLSHINYLLSNHYNVLIVYILIHSCFVIFK